MEPKVTVKTKSVSTPHKPQKLPAMNQNSCYPRLRVIFKGNVKNIVARLRVTSTHTSLTSASLQVGPWSMEVKDKVGFQRLNPALGRGLSLIGKGWALRRPTAPGAQSAHYLGLEDFSQMEKFYHTACLPSCDFYSHLIIGKFQL